MADKDFVMKLAKLVIAAAWADGEVAGEEMNALKDLIFGLGEITGREWTELEMYLYRPVEKPEQEQLLREVLESAKSPEDKALVVDTIRVLVEADGVVTQEEEALLDEVTKAMEEQSTGILSTLGRMVRRAMGKRSTAGARGAGREERLDDYIRNRIYFRLVTSGEREAIDLPEEKGRKLCLAAGIMAQVAWVDEDMSQGEKDAITRVLVARWGLGEIEAKLVSDISTSPEAKEIDYQRLTRSFYESTDLDERKSFINCLFEIANASQNTAHEEIEEIRKIAISLKVAHGDFIAAKLSISQEERRGL